jgi:hypothetical protein
MRDVRVRKSLPVIVVINRFAFEPLLRQIPYFPSIGVFSSIVGGCHVSVPDVGMAACSVFI